MEKGAVGFILLGGYFLGSVAAKKEQEETEKGYIFYHNRLIVG